MTSEDHLDFLEVKIESLARALPAMAFVSRDNVVPAIAEKMGSQDLFLTLGAPSEALAQATLDSLLRFEVYSVEEPLQELEEGLWYWAGIISRAYDVTG